MIISEETLNNYWNDIPIGINNACTYDELCEKWNTYPRAARLILHELSRFDNGDNYILIRSSRGRGFYKTDNEAEIAAYRAECLNRGKNTFAPLRKINRVLTPATGQYNFINNLREMRIACNKKQTEVCEQMRKYGNEAFDTIMLSKMENNRCIPTPLQLAHLAAIYGCTAGELVNMDIYAAK